MSSRHSSPNASGASWWCFYGTVKQSTMGREHFADVWERKQRQRGNISEKWRERRGLSDSGFQRGPSVSQRRFSTAGHFNRKPLPYMAVAGCCVWGCSCCAMFPWQPRRVSSPPASRLSHIQTRAHASVYTFIPDSLQPESSAMTHSHNLSPKVHPLLDLSLF